MIGVVIVAHGQLADAFKEATELIMDAQEGFIAVSVGAQDKADLASEALQKAIRQADQGDGVLILTDMFGGTPSNLSYSFLEEGRIEVLSGVNLPVLIQAVNMREKMKLNELAANLEAFGKKSISLASGILKGNKRS